MWTIRVKEEEKPPEEKPPKEEKPEQPPFPYLPIDFSKLMPLLIAGAFIGLVLYALKD